MPQETFLTAANPPAPLADAPAPAGRSMSLPDRTHLLGEGKVLRRHD